MPVLRAIGHDDAAVLGADDPRVSVLDDEHRRWVDGEDLRPVERVLPRALAVGARWKPPAPGFTSGLVRDHPDAGQAALVAPTIRNAVRLSSSGPIVGL